MKKLLLILCASVMLIGCSSQANCDANFDISSGSVCVLQQEKSFSVVDFSAQLHNDAIVAFFEYAEENHLEGYDDSILSTLEAFMQDYVVKRIAENTNLTDIFNDKDCQISEDRIQYVCNSLISIIADGTDYYEIDKQLRDFTSNALPECQSEQEQGIYQLICGVAIGTNQLWEKDWDYERYPIGNLSAASSSKEDSTDEDKKEEDKKKKEDQEKLKKADIRGAGKGALKGLIWGAPIGGFAGAIWGALIRGSAQAAVDSAAEALFQKYSEESDIQ